MLNQETTTITSLSRREYNKQYYLKRKQELLAKKKKRANVFQLFSKKTSLEPRNSKSFQATKLLEAAVLIVLVTMMTTCLVSEAARFYIDASEKPWMAYLKAGTIEVVAILFSFSRGRQLALRWAQRILVVLLSAFTLTSMSTVPIKSASLAMTKVRSGERTIATLEAELHQKESLQSQLVAKEWLGAARRYEKGVDELRGNLANARQAMALLEAPAVVLNGLIALLAFRLLIVATNLICFHRIAEILSNSATQKLGFGAQ